MGMGVASAVSLCHREKTCVDQTWVFTKSTKNTRENHFDRNM
jgi:hypothetical protein